MIDKATQSDDNDEDDTNFWLATPGFGESLIEAEVDYAAGRTFSGDEIRDHFGLPPREATRPTQDKTGGAQEVGEDAMNDRAPRAERWQRREHDVDAHVAAGEVAVHADGEALLDHLDQLDAGADSSGP